MAQAVGAACLLAFLAAAPSIADSASATPVLDVPLVRQRKDGCGAASLVMVLQYWRAARPDLALPAPDADQLYRTLYSASDKGIPATSLIRHLEHNGFHALAVNATRDDIQAHLAKGRPLIATLKDGSRLHYVVVRGLEPGSVWINDPWDGKPHRLAWQDFDKRWKGADRWLLLAVPRPSSSR